MPSIPGPLRLAPRALLFDGDAYLEVKTRPRALRDGALLLLVLGAALGLTGAARAVVAWGAAPDAQALSRTLARGLERLPVLQRLGPPAGDLPRRWAWAVPAAPAPGPAPLLSAPLMLVAGWLSYGLLAQIAARLLGGRAGLGATLACLALAEAPRVLLLIPWLPPLGLAAVGVEAWVLAARFQALRAAHGLEGWRAFWAAVAAALLLGLAGVGLAALGAQPWSLG